MAKKSKNSEQTGEKKPNTRPQAFTPLNARQAQEASVRSRNLRKQVRAQILNTIVTELDLGQELKKAIVTGDLDRVNLLQTAFKMIGLNHDQSEDAVKSGISVKAAQGGTDDNKSEPQTLKVDIEVV